MAAITHAHLGLPEPLKEHELPISFEIDEAALDHEGVPHTISFAARTSKADTEGEDQGSIIYINTIPNIPEADAELKKLQKDNEITSSFWSYKATEATKLKEQSGDLPGGNSAADAIKRTNYRIRVIEYALGNSSW